MDQAQDYANLSENDLIEVPLHLRILTYIKSKGYVLRIIAERSGIADKKFYKIMDGTCRLTADDLEKICTKGLGVEPALFFENKFSELEN